MTAPINTLPVPVRWHEVQQAVHPVVLYVAPVQPALVGKVLAELLVDVLRADAPAVLAVDRVAEAGRVDDRQPQLHPPLLDVERLLLDAGRLLDPLLDRRHRPLGVQLGQEERVDERRLAEAGFAAHHQRELEATLHRFAVHLLRQRGEPDVITLWKWQNKYMYLNIFRSCGRGYEISYPERIGRSGGIASSHTVCFIMSDTRLNSIPAIFQGSLVVGERDQRET